MRRLLKRLERKTTRDAIVLLLAVAGTVGAGLWTVFVYFVPPPRAQAPAETAQPAKKLEAAEQVAPSKLPVARTVVAEGGIAIGGDVQNATVSVADSGPE